MYTHLFAGEIVKGVRCSDKETTVLLDKQFARPYPTGSTTTATPWETAVLQFIIAKLEEPLDSSKPLLER
jgi:hypothetical protein